MVLSCPLNHDLPNTEHFAFSFTKRSQRTKLSKSFRKNIEAVIKLSPMKTLKTIENC